MALLNRVACDNGHPWIEENIMFVRAGVKRCRICNRADELRKLAPKQCSKCGDSFASLRMHMRRMHPTTSKEG